MSKSEKVIFDELDEKIHSEILFLMEVIASFGNKIARMLAPMHQDVETAIENEIRGKNHWQIKYNRKNIFYPLTKDEYSSQTKITKLDCSFSISNYFNVAKIISGKWKNYLIVEFGYFAQMKEDDDPDLRCFYFSVYKAEDYESYGGIINDKDFYLALSQNTKNYDCTLTHPAIDGEPERFELRVNSLNVEKVLEAKKVFIDLVLIPSLRKLK